MSLPSLPGADYSGPPYTLSSLFDAPDLIDEHQTVGGSAWPEFMLHDPVAIANWNKLMAYFGDYQLSLLIDGGIAAVINMVPLHLDLALSNLPDRGVDWGVEKSVADFEEDRPPNAALALQVVIAGEFRRQGLSPAATGEMIRHARRKNLDHVLLPVRPNDKQHFPLIPMADYVCWTRPDGLPFDSWLRVHKRLGGEILGICSQSMTIPGRIADWRRWTGQEFPGSGPYIVSGALNPVHMNIEQDQGLYVEPNVWVRHQPRSG